MEASFLPGSVLAGQPAGPLLASSLVQLPASSLVPSGLQLLASGVWLLASSFQSGFQLPAGWPAGPASSFGFLPSSFQLQASVQLLSYGFQPSSGFRPAGQSGFQLLADWSAKVLT